jgi:hypothetical protein
MVLLNQQNRIEIQLKRNRFTLHAEDFLTSGLDHIHMTKFAKCHRDRLGVVAVIHQLHLLLTFPRPGFDQNRIT